MRKSNLSSAPIEIKRMIRDFLTESENETLNRTNKALAAPDFLQLCDIDFPKENILLERQAYEVKDSKNASQVPKNSEDIRNKNRYGKLAKLAYSNLDSEKRDLLQVVKNPKTNLTDFLSVLDTSLWSDIKSTMETELAFTFSDVEKHLFERYKNELTKELASLDYKNVVNNDEETNKEIESLLIRFDVENELSQVRVRWVSKSQSSHNCIIKKKNPNATAQEPDFETENLDGFQEKIRFKILTTDLIGQKLNEFYAPHDPQNLDQPLARKYFNETIQIILLFKKRVFDLAGQYIARLPEDPESLSRNAFILAGIAELFRSSKWDWFLKVRFRALIGNTNSIAAFCDSMAVKVLPLVLKTLNENDRAELNLFRNNKLSKKLNDLQVKLLEVSDHYGNVVFHLYNKNRFDILNFLYQTTSRCLDLERQLKNAIIFHQLESEIFKLFDALDISQHVADQYLAFAIKAGNVTAVLFLLKQLKMDINKPIAAYDHGSALTPLQLACVLGDMKMIEVLHKEFKANVLTNNGGTTALHLAVKHQHIRAATYLLKEGKKEAGENLEQFHKFLNAKADIFAARNITRWTLDKDFQGNTALNLATILNDMPMITLLVSHGASFNSADRFGMTPEEAFAARNAKALKAALQSEKPGVAATQSNARYRPAARRAPIIAPTESESQLTPEQIVRTCFMYALMSGNQMYLQEYLETRPNKEALVNTVFADQDDKKEDGKPLVNNNGKGVLHLLLESNHLQGKIDSMDWKRFNTIKYILSLSAKPLHIRNLKGQTPLFYILNEMASAGGNLGKYIMVAKLFVHYDHSILEATNDQGQTPIAQLEARMMCVKQNPQQLTEFEQLETLWDIFKAMPSKAQGHVWKAEKEADVFGTAEQSNQQNSLIGLDFLNDIDERVRQKKRTYQEGYDSIMRLTGSVTTLESKLETGQSRVEHKVTAQELAVSMGQVLKPAEATVVSKQESESVVPSKR